MYDYDDKNAINRTSSHSKRQLSKRIKSHKALTNTNIFKNQKVIHEYNMNKTKSSMNLS